MLKNKKVLNSKLNEENLFKRPVLTDKQKRILLLNEIGNSHNFTGLQDEAYYKDLFINRLPELRLLIKKHKDIDLENINLYYYRNEINDDLKTNAEPTYWHYAIKFLDSVLEKSPRLKVFNNLISHKAYKILKPLNDEKKIYFNLFSTMSYEDLINIFIYKNIWQFYSQSGKFFKFSFKVDFDYFFERATELIGNTKSLSCEKISEEDLLSSVKSLEYYKLINPLVNDIYNKIGEKFPRATSYEKLLLLGEHFVKHFERFHIEIEKEIIRSRQESKMLEYIELCRQHKQPLKIAEQKKWQILANLVKENFEKIEEQYLPVKDTKFSKLKQQIIDDAIDKKNILYRKFGKNFRRTLKNKSDISKEILNVFLSQNADNYSQAIRRIVIYEKEPFILEDALEVFSVDDLFYLYNFTNNFISYTAKLYSEIKEGELSKDFSNCPAFVLNQMKLFQNGLELSINHHFCSEMEYTNDEVAETLKIFTEKLISKQQYCRKYNSGINLGDKAFVTLQRMFPDESNDKLKENALKLQRNNTSYQKSVSSFNIVK